jgi:hypothetical protein
MTELDPDARMLIQLARPNEGATPADRARVRRRLSAVLGAGVIAAGTREALDSGIQTSSTPLPDSAGHTLLERVSGEVLRVAPVAKSAGLLAAAPALAMHAAALLLGGALVGGTAWFAARAVSDLEPTSAHALTAPAARGAENGVSGGDAPAKSERASALTPGETRVSESLVPQPEPLDAEPSSPADELAPIQLEDLPVLEDSRDAKASRAGRGARTQRADRGHDNSSKGGVGRKAASERRGSWLAEEARQLAAVHEALREGDHTLALTRLEAMDRRPGGVLGEERLVARVLSLCGLARVGEAEAIARRVESVAPESPLLPRLGASCANGALSGIRRVP